MRVQGSGFRVYGLGFRVDGLGLRFWYVRVCCKRVRQMDTQNVIIVHFRERVEEQNSEVQVFATEVQVFAPKHLHLRVLLLYSFPNANTCTSELLLYSFSKRNNNYIVLIVLIRLY